MGYELKKLQWTENFKKIILLGDLEKITNKLFKKSFKKIKENRLFISFSKSLDFLF